MLNLIIPAEVTFTFVKFILKFYIFIYNINIRRHSFQYWYRSRLIFNFTSADKVRGL